MSRLRRLLAENAVVLLFAALIAAAIPLSGAPPLYLLQEVLTRLGRNAVLVLSLLIASIERANSSLKP